MKADRVLKHLAAAFGIAVLVYVVAYAGIEHRRTRRGPWQVTFTNTLSRSPMLVIQQPGLAIRNVRIEFPGEMPASHPAVTLVFQDPRPVPFEVPFGKCVFMDTTFLPGTIVLELFGHQIQLLPRVLTIDQREHPWRSDTNVACHHH